MAQIEFFHPIIETQSINRISEIMLWAEKSLQIEMCYVTEFGTKLLKKHADHLLRDGSFIIVANESINDIKGLNELAKIRPESVRFISAKSNAKESSVEGLMHAKLIYAENGDDCILWVGSNNFTSAALLGANIEAALVVSGKMNEQVFEDAREHLQKVKKLSEAGPIPTEPEPISVTEVIIIECEASPTIIKQLSSGNQSFCVYLRHDMYDDECIPASRKNTSKKNKEVRLYLYSEKSLTKLGPIKPPVVVRSGRLNGVTFTEKNPSDGTSASWKERIGYDHVTIHHSIPDDPTSALEATLGKSPDDDAWTISSFIIDNKPKNEIFLADRLTPTLKGKESEEIIKFNENFFKNSNESALIKDNKKNKTTTISIKFVRNQRPGYATKYYGSIDNIHHENLTKLSINKGFEIFPIQNKAPHYFFIRRGYISDTSKL